MKIEKVEKLVANLHDKSECAIHVRNFKQALSYRLVLKKVNRFIKFNQNAWLKPYIDINTDLREKAKRYFEKDFLKLMNNVILNYNNIKLFTAERRRNYLVSEPSYHITKFFTENLLKKQKTNKKKNRDTYE